MLLKFFELYNKTIRQALRTNIIQHKQNDSERSKIQSAIRIPSQNTHIFSGFHIFGGYVPSSGENQGFSNESDYKELHPDNRDKFVENFP